MAMGIHRPGGSGMPSADMILVVGAVQVKFG
jgi:hypothetical protein